MINKVLTYLLLLLFMGCAASSANMPKDDSLQHVWAIDVDQRLPADGMGFSQAAVTTSGLIVIGGQDAKVHIYQADGGEVGHISIAAACDSGAEVLSNGLVVLSDVSGVLYAISPDKKQIVWQYQLSASLTGKAVVLDGGFVLQTADNRIYSFSETGEKLWSYAGNSTGLGLYLNASPMVLDGVVYAVFSNGDAVAIQADNGDLSWRRQLLLDNDAPVLSELRVVVADPIALKHAAFRTQQSDDVLLIGFYQGDMMLLSKKDGSQQFSHALSIKSSPKLLGQTLYISDAKGFVHAIDQQNGQVLWQKKLSQGELVGPVVWQDKLWFADDKGQVMRLNMDGGGLAVGKVQGRVDRSPMVTSFGVLIRSDIGTLHLFN